MDKGTGRASSAARVAAGDSPATIAAGSLEFEGIVEEGAIKLVNGRLPEGTRVQVRVKK